jgi:hypothetical protein
VTLALVCLAPPTTPAPESPYVRRPGWPEAMSDTREAWLRSPEGAAGPVVDGVFKPYDSGVIPGDGPAVRVALSVAGVKTLRLLGIIEQGTGNCHIWGEPTLIAKDGTATKLTSLKPASVTVGWGSLLVDKNWQDRPLQVGERKLAFGLWVHGNSELRYTLDGKYERFEAWFGEDKDRAVGKLRCQVLGGEPLKPPACWTDLSRDFAQPSAWLAGDLGLDGVAAWFARRDRADLERELLGRLLAPAGASAEPLRAEAAALTEAKAGAGDQRWLALYLRAARCRDGATTLRGVSDGEGKAALTKDFEALVAGKAAWDDPRWGGLRARLVQIGEVDCQWDALTHDIGQRKAMERWAAEAYRPEALVKESDRDPLDIVLRRSAALLADLRKTAAAPKLVAPGEQLAALTKTAADVPPAETAKRKALFAQACALRRTIAFTNPLLDFGDIVFIKRHRSIYNHMCDQFYGIAAAPGGGLYVLRNAFGPNPEVRDVLAGATVGNGRLKGQVLLGGTRPARLSWDGARTLHGDETSGGAFLSPALSYDGRQIAFAYVECRGDRNQQYHTDATKGHWDEGRAYHLFKVNVDGTGLTQLTDGTWNDFDPCWLPNGRVAFITERRGGYLRCGRACPLYNLYDMNADGSGINALSFHESNEWNPSVTHDGRLVYTRWDYVDRHGCTAHHPWITTLDGTDSRALHGNFSVRGKRADMELAVQAVPGSSLFVATGAPHHGQHFGSLVLVDPNVNDDDAMSSVRRLTPEVAFPESQGGREVYGTPFPLSPDYHLCVYDDAMNSGNRRRGGGNYGIYLIDAWGNRELLYRDPEIGCSKPIPLRATRKPPVTPSPSLTIAQGGVHHAALTSPKPVTIGDEGEGTMAVMDVYETIKPWAKDTRIRELRVLQLLPMSVPSGFPPHETGKRIAEAGDSVVPARWVLGTVPVEPDGSAHFKVPAYRELFFQALDDRGMAIQSMRSATYVRDGERLVCQGCHEHKRRAVAVKGMPAALQRAPSTITPDVDGSKPFSYPRLVQPVLDAKCVPCHTERKDKKAPNLGREPIANKWYASYNTLINYGFTAYRDHYRTRPGEFGARASRLMALLDKGHHDVKLTAEERHRLVLWLDCASMFYGVFEQAPGEAQLRGEIAQPTLW